MRGEGSGAIAVAIVVLGGVVLTLTKLVRDFVNNAPDSRAQRHSGELVWSVEPLYSSAVISLRGGLGEL